MIFSLINFLRGYLTISVKGNFIERFINLAIKNNIYLWNIKMTGLGEAEVKISIRGFLKIRPVALKTGVRVRIKERHGLSMFMHRHRKRKAFYIGFFVFFAILVYLTSFIWSVEIVGNENTQAGIIERELRSCGIYSGALKYGHSSQKIKKEMLIKVPSLSWIWVEIKGTRAIVSVKERTEKPEIFDKNTPCNIIAARDGVIESTLIRDGIGVVESGDIVKKGDLLVSGVADSRYNGIRFINADGEIYATTWHEKSGTFPLSRSEFERTGNKKRKLILNAWGKDLQILPIGKIKYKSYDEEINENKMKIWGDMYLPLTIKSGFIFETGEKIIKMSESEAASFYGEMLENEIKETLQENCSVSDREITYNKENDKITITVTLKCRENIAQKTVIEVEDKFD